MMWNNTSRSPQGKYWKFNHKTNKLLKTWCREGSSRDAFQKHVLIYEVHTNLVSLSPLMIFHIATTSYVDQWMVPLQEKNE